MPASASTAPEAAPPPVTAPATAEAKQPAAKKSSAKKSSAKTAARKSSAKKASTRKAAPAAKKGTPLIEPSDDEIRLRAYFIAERRTRQQLHGDQANDWLQARQELLAELNSKSDAQE